MKSAKLCVIALLISALAIPGLAAQSQEPGAVKGMSLSGATGLFSIPTARTGWERASSFAIDLGYHTIISEGYLSHIPKLSMSLFRFLELSAALDFQPDGFINPDSTTDLIAGAKIQIPLDNISIALGGNYQRLNTFNDDHHHNAGQVYMAFTYMARIFNSPAETSVVFGKTFMGNNTDSSIDFGVGFNIVLLPGQFGSFLNWVTDFANFSYSAEPFGADSWFRGVINTGLRLDFSAIKAFNKLRFAVDIMLADAFDTNRAFSAGLVIGVPIF